jgi:hypothetical protein
MRSLAERFGLPAWMAIAARIPAAGLGRGSFLLIDRKTGERLRAAGPAPARKFSWQRTARQTLAASDRALT